MIRRSYKIESQRDRRKTFLPLGAYHTLVRLIFRLSTTELQAFITRRGYVRVAMKLTCSPAFVRADSELRIYRLTGVWPKAEACTSSYGRF